jgi:hypothetical protein
MDNVNGINLVLSSPGYISNGTFPRWQCLAVVPSNLRSACFNKAQLLHNSVPTTFLAVGQNGVTQKALYKQ